MEHVGKGHLVTTGWKSNHESIAFMYGITYIYHKNQLSVGKYTIHSGQIEIFHQPRFP